MKTVAEQIFAHAVSLEQVGRQKNMIFGWKNIIFILNYDKTVLLRFEMKQELFKDPIGFFVNDYDSDEFRIEEGMIIFTRQGIEFQREKKCGTPNQSFRDIEELFFKYLDVATIEQPSITVRKGSLELFNPDLSHIELKGKEGKIIVRQQDIYSGTILELTRPKDKGFQLGEFLTWKDNIPQDFGPIGIRTSDFLTLFAFHGKVQLYFLNNYFIVEGKTTQYKMMGVIGGCLYDELGTIEDLSRGDCRTDDKKLASDPSAKAVEADTVRKSHPLASRQISFRDLTPGTPEWMEYWESHMEEQHEMLDYKKEVENGRQEQKNRNTLKKVDRKNQMGRNRLLRRRVK